MCVVIYTFPPPFKPAYEIESVAELRALAGKIVCFESSGKALAEATERGDYDDGCLCHVDVEATLEGTPFTARRTASGDDWELINRSADPAP